MINPMGVFCCEVFVMVEGYFKLKNLNDIDIFGMVMKVD